MISASPIPPRAPCLTAALCICSLTCAGALAAEPPAAIETDGISDNLERRAGATEEERIPGLDALTSERKRWRDLIGLDYTLSYYGVAIGAFVGDDAPGAGGGDLTLQGIWKPGHRWSENPTELHFRLRSRHAYGSLAPSAIRGEIGALWGVIDGFSDSGFEIPDFYLRHHLPQSGIDLRYGQMTVDSQFDSHQLRSSKQSFLNQAFSSNPAVGFPRFGVGLTLRKDFSNGFDLTIGATNVQGTKNGDQVDFKFNSRDLFQALQFGYDFKACGTRESRAQLLLWRSDGVGETGDPESQGASLMFEQEIRGRELRAFARLAYSEGGGPPIDLLASGGLAWQVNNQDLLGFAAGIGRSSGPGDEVQTVLEGFYRWQPREGIRISPNFQVLAGEGFAGSPGLRLIVGLRAGIEF